MFFAIRHSISATWLNDRDQFSWPNDGWKIDIEFQNDCLTYLPFWIPFTEQDVNASRFESHFMTGKIKIEEKSLFGVFGRS